MALRLGVKGAIDLEALSPRDANAQRMPNKVADIKVKAAQFKAAKEKEHPPPPPSQVAEPASASNPKGSIYQVGKLLGKGGFAICYHGQLEGTKQRYALKIVKSKMPPKMEQKFQTELQIHSKMKHKNIVQFLRAFTFEQSTYLVLELCPNGSLMDLVKRRKGLTEPEVRFYAVQVAGAIKYMHGKGIIHRDLKMGNIFLDSRMNAKVGDFGLAALVVTGRDMQTIRRTTLCGTPNYIAPEILEKGKKGHDHSVCYAYVQTPFQSSTTDEIYRRARERDYDWPDPETTQKFISGEAKDLVASMLESPESRPDPDSIVQHPWFRVGYMPIPADMTPKLRELPPERSEFYLEELTEKQYAESLENLKNLSTECMVGPYAPSQIVHSQVWKEMAAEEKACLTPMIPSPRTSSASSTSSAPRRKLIAENAQQLLQTAQEAIPSLRSLPRRERQQTADPLALPSRSQTLRKTESDPITRTGGAGHSRTDSSASGSRQGGTREANSAPATVRLHPTPVVKSSLFSSRERTLNVEGTQPDVILGRLQRLQAELERALNARTMAIITSKTVAPLTLRWCIGCVLREIATPEGSKAVLLPPACMLIQDSERHVQLRQDERYADRHQPLAMSPEQFRVAVGEDGVPAKLGPGSDAYQYRKRERIILWKKFANYMIAYGRDDGVASDESPASAPPAGQEQVDPAQVVIFYQRFGDVGCWVFAMVTSTRSYRHADAQCARRAGVLSYPLQTLLNFQTKPTAARSTRSATTSTRRRPEIAPELQGIPAANDFRRKVDFIKRVVKEWVGNGGLGNSSMSREGRLRWTGYRETVNVPIPQKHVWVTEEEGVLEGDGSDGV
ncbi:unnamed protein product [Parascedosporium putredinis]|uniref:Protein kinase domain-containing protein n=1 Tax=Parascedosporium putredinis TaxID=1442378 RepID=A0A9P1MCY0_9PEZI|nr:unnamed protein product [Parascedosporium putredinis]CAI7997654.1 unnamed protein product [Parascedosporium putredinis]